MTDEKRDPNPEDGEEFRIGREDPDGAETPIDGEEDELSRVKTRMAYLAAEFDNYRKRTAREKEAIVSFGNERLLLAILPFLDNLERAISQPGAAGAILSGVRMTYDQLLAGLRKFGLEQIEAVGKPFDPNLHEAVGVVPGEGSPDGTVLAESCRGYLLNGRLLRPAHVTVAQSPSAPSGDGEDADSGSAGREG